MSYWIIPFAGFAVLVLVGLSVLVVEYQDQRSHRYNGPRRVT